MTVRRLAWIVPSAILIAALIYTAWLTWQVQVDLRAAESSASDLQAAWRAQDEDARDAAAADLAEHADAARDHTDGVWWQAMQHAPILGDDATGVAALSRSLDIVAEDAVTPLSTAVDGAGDLVVDGRIDLETVAALEDPVATAHRALVDADLQLDGLNSADYVGALRTRFDRYADLVQEMRSGLASAEKAVRVLPSMAGSDGPRDYLLIFQNNAEIRATGGLPGSWALVNAEDGKMGIVKQGAGVELPFTNKTVALLTAEELAVYDRPFAQYFLDAGFTPDFPRAAQLWDAHWRLSYPDEKLDGVVAIDPVALSYLLAGTGPIEVAGSTLTSENIVEQLLSQAYVDLPVAQQDAYFQAVARDVFAAVTSELASPVAFLQGVNRAVSEGRLMVSSFHEESQRELAGTRVAGELVGDDGDVPHVDIGLNDLTGAKMSYYLRYDSEVRATSCQAGAQTISGAFRLRQAIAPADAAQLPPYITGGGRFGTDIGSQYVMVRIYGPWGGSLDDLRLDGKALENATVRELNGRPVVSIDVLLSSQKDALITWQATTGEGQTADGVVSATPSVVPGGDSHTFDTAC